MSAFDEMLAPIFRDPLKTSGSAEMPFKVGDSVRPNKFGWSGVAEVLEVRGDHCRIGSMEMFGRECPVWFHRSELLPALTSQIVSGKVT